MEISLERSSKYMEMVHKGSGGRWWREQSAWLVADSSWSGATRTQGHALCMLPVVMPRLQCWFKSCHVACTTQLYHFIHTGMEPVLPWRNHNQAGGSVFAETFLQLSQKTKAWSALSRVVELCCMSSCSIEKWTSPEPLIHRVTDEICR